MKRVLDMVILLELLALICVNSGRFGGRELFARRASEENSRLSSMVWMGVGEAQLVFPEMTELIQGESGIYEARANGNLLGYVLKSLPDSEKISGFMGQTPLLIAMDAQYRILKVHPLPNSESPDFFARVVESKLLETWNGLKPAEVMAKEVDAVSGATYSSRAVIQSMQARMASLTDMKPARSSSKSHLADAAFLILLATTLLAFFKPSLIGKWRILLMAASVAILAIWQGRLLSVAQCLAWLTGGIPVAAQWTLLVLFLLSLLLPILFGKAFYCAWVCPMGAAQGLLGELNRKHRLKLPPSLLSALQLLRSAILWFGLLAVGMGLTFDFSAYEAFSLFHPQTAPMMALILGILSLALSIWIQRPWCRFLCPLGEFLELIRTSRTPSPSGPSGISRPSGSSN